MQTNSPTEIPKWMALITVALGYFAVQLAMTSVPPILPTLTRLFEADVSLVSWVMTAYFLTVTSSMLMTGRLGDVDGLPASLCLGNGGLHLGHHGLWTGPEHGAIDRPARRARNRWGNGVWQQLGHRHQRLSCLSTWTGGGGLSDGFLPGGYAGHGAGNVIGAVRHLAMVVLCGAAHRGGGGSASLCLRASHRPSLAGAASHGKRFDVLGGVLAFAALTTLLLGVSHLHNGEPSFSSGGVYHLTLLTLSVYCLIALLIAERRAANPLLPLQRFRDHVFSSAIASNGILHMTMWGIFF